MFITNLTNIMLQSTMNHFQFILNIMNSPTVYLCGRRGRSLVKRELLYFIFHNSAILCTVYKTLWTRRGRSLVQREQGWGCVISELPPLPLLKYDFTIHISDSQSVHHWLKPLIILYFFYISILINILPRNNFVFWSQDPRLAKLAPFGLDKGSVWG